MPATSDLDSPPERAQRRSVRASRAGLTISLLSACVLFSGCVEFAHFGQVMDRESSGSVNDVKIEQQRQGGGWETLGHTDGKGRWNILKYKISGGGRVRLSKRGYRTVIMPESDFLQQNNILLMPDQTNGLSEEFLRP